LLIPLTRRNSPKAHIPMIKPGSLVTVKNGDFTRTEVYTGPTPVIWPHLTLRRRALRALTPRRWRKPLKPIYPADPVERQKKLIEQALKTIDQLVRP